MPDDDLAEHLRRVAEKRAKKLHRPVPPPRCDIDNGTEDDEDG